MPNRPLYLENTLSSREIDEWGNEGRLSPELCEAMSLADTSEGIIALIELSSPELDEPFLVSSNATEFLELDKDSKEPIYGTIFQDRRFVYCPFSLELFSEEEGGEVTAANISIANVDSRISISLREISLALDFKIYLLRKNDRSRAQMVLDNIKLVDTTTSVDAISGSLAGYNYGAEPCTPNYTKGEYRTL